MLIGCGDVREDQAQSPEVSKDAWRAGLDRSDLGLEAKRLAGGGQMVDLRGRYRHAQVVSVENGSRSLVCANRAAALDAVLDHAETDEAK